MRVVFLPSVMAISRPRATMRLNGLQADEGVAAHLLAALHRLQQKALAFLPRGPQKSRDRRFKIGSQGAAEGHKRVFFGERQELFAAGLEEIG